MGKRFLFLSDFNSQGSGYLSISAPLCEGLTSFGNEVKAIGIRYTGDEHHFNFSIIPCKEDFREAKVMIENLSVLWPFDVLVVAADIPVQKMMLSILENRPFKYIAITPLEMGPLSMEWAAALFQADKVFFISELGKQEALKVGLPAEHLLVGINTNKWFPMTIEEKRSARQLLGYTDDDLVILMVADNQERKNLPAAYKTISLLKRVVQAPTKIKFVIVTRVNQQHGWSLAELRSRYGLLPMDVAEYERGMSNEQLRLFYCTSDVFLLSSKAEGLGLPVLEAMSCGTPVVATNTGAITELLSGGRGCLVDYEYEIECDVWGCSGRRFMSSEDAARKIAGLFADEFDVEDMLRNAREYVVNRKSVVMVKQIMDAAEEVCK
jgi:glycosyltransferase involved in cell wall biosynthesis